ncbi:ABC transporter ATP-binding protein [Phenylobacterium sp. SCN 70-31]|uniref:ABC transporter ATP-binding protein n=1 Tax=Phenylobacterium sp. SCN 70-31 TaxID=1660129 RepID=UPI00086A2121|nr:ABC transporter ATP-binding protein [Phenylobacterium sp. SCN 70-31]ODT87995.1 MAG: ABC transporter [Phenylobacterium sp. SCN 70-31]
MSDAVLSIRGLERTYVTAAGALPVLTGADLDVRPGEIVGLVGPSGSGKSSLLHAAGLLEHPDGGRIAIQGRDCTHLNERERTRVRLATIGFVYQFHHLLPEFSALDNVALPMMIAGAGRRAASDRARDLLTSLGLGERTHHHPPQLSGGEQQRVAIARALANRPRLLLADEPTGNLDPTTSGTVFDSLYALARSQGVAAVVATHNLELAGHMDRVLALRDGRLEPWTPSGG